MAKIRRRDLLRTSLAISGTLLGGISYEHQTLLAQLVDRSEYGKVKEPVKGLQRGKFGKYEVSRLIIGGNLISGSAHAGELLYQSALMTHYFNTEKILETWALAEQNGINTTLMRADPHIIEHYDKFRKERGGKLQWIAQSAPEQGDPVENAKRARDHGAIAVYLHGGVSDGFVKQGKVEAIGDVVEGIRKTGLMAGIGAHMFATTRACVEAQLDPDFFMVTTNRVKYNCDAAAETAELMKTHRKPWIGFKVLGAGRELPPAGFRHAFERGADFIAVGMFDWQVRDDAAHVQAMLAEGVTRERAWA